MNRGGKADELQGRKKVHIRLRSNLVVTHQRDEMLNYHVIKDPISLSYFRLDERQWFVLNLMDGTRTLEDIQKAYELAHRPDRLPLEELEAFTALLVNGGLAHHESTLAGRLLLDQSNKQWWQALQARLLGFLSFKIPVCNPDRWLTRLLPWVRFLFAPWFVVLGLSVALMAVGMVVTHWADFLARLPDQREFFSLHTLLYLWLALGLVKVLHELGHGLCCKAFGGEVHELGVLLLFGLAPPCTATCRTAGSYLDVGSAWRSALRASTWSCWIATGALFSGGGRAPAPCCTTSALALMVVCSVHTLVFNGNPLLRFDGYHVLADWLNVPNLAEVSGPPVAGRLPALAGGQRASGSAANRCGPGCWPVMRSPATFTAVLFLPLVFIYFTSS